MNDKVHGDTPILRVENLSHSFREGEGKVLALRGVSFEARAGEVTAIVGPSGCGKSTMLYLLGLLDRPDSGEVYLRDKPMAQADDATRTALRNESIGFVFQFHFLIKEFTARENVALPLRKAGKPPEKALTQADKFLDQLGLADKADRFVNKLSGGEQQRVAIARALANSPDL
ncbi:MAG: ABC transporter ATP-binding protein, partial [Opitutales bacterium]